MRYGREDPEARWDLLVDALPDEWRTKWKQPSIRTEASDYVKRVQTSAARLLELLQTENPKTFNAGWINRYDSSLYRAIEKFRSSENESGFSVIVKMLPPKWQNKWIPRVRAHALRENYSNIEEVEEVMAKHRDKLYVVLEGEPKDKEIKVERDLIYRELVELAQRGNLIAWGKVKNYAEIIVNIWIDRLPDFDIYKNKGGLISEILDARIRNFKREGSFIGYVYNSLTTHTKKLKDDRSLGRRLL